jgi:hypothetical protein
MTVRCGNRKAHGTDHLTGAYHRDSAEVRACYAAGATGIPSLEEEAADQEALAELMAEQAVERYFEDRGYEEARFQEQQEARLGVVQFGDAMAAAEAARELEVAAAAPAKSPLTFVEQFSQMVQAQKDGTPVAALAYSDEVVTQAESGPELAAPQGVPEPVATPQPDRPVLATEPVYDGVYTVETPGGHRTLQLRTQGPKESFAPGKQIASFLSGPDNERDYTGFAFVEGGRAKVWKKHKANVALLRDLETLLSDPSGALTMAHCFRCHRPLTVPASVHAGLGPECAKKVGS